ncbi:MULTISPECIES: UDP-N-acetylglucosamine--dolichyl-phosphate N-acetylglucosaminephosphotransferase [Pyrobaculum]|uniref:Glycosyl transferase, family 4 n=2 Tax=Pyrobaculum arsenaticum TaxID=121277 RepID=A4WM99_PYRAR|nr:UDP-N-acetylglucosamine--dolichyl-phosphate N-acetylglucosaminephosphotransferase [Pyrobaculum arsenaticum]ABP51516.1 glycosyl transferase, family 4 [Pyrobaculum arsenaticum DSM 13514]MCY0890994.1 UDP-N-acetylglucosamine--dolichyl-phosphate N-acetylglucosaminephosphotransferase [Pyrobaculum arsenaticum]NYR16515.1 UDP-N-acetylglucosamine--dolichyl-phosphate N-acetylglucosaminephosphotransferase [Pyrobaculum arsenaticum]
MFAEIVSAVAAFIAGVVFGLWWVGEQKRRNITSRDIYKNISGVPRAGGLIAMVAATVGYSLLSTITDKSLLVLVISMIMGILGLVDDLKGLSEYVRVLVPVVLAFALARTSMITLTVPMVGLFYGATGWLSVLAIPVLTNAFNMLDPVNGFLPMANTIVGLSLAAVAAMRGQWDAVYLLAVHAAASLSLYVHNRYPAKTFNGNVGSYFLGASISTIAVLYDLVPYLILAGLPFVVNGALIIFSSGGIKGREKIERPTYLENGLVYQQCNSPIISLVRLTVANGPMNEYGIFKALTVLTATTSALTVATTAVIHIFSLPI